MMALLLRKFNSKKRLLQDLKTTEGKKGDSTGSRFSRVKFTGTGISREKPTGSRFNREKSTGGRFSRESAQAVGSAGRAHRQ